MKSTKRLLDVTVSSIALIVLSPLYVAVAAAIRATLGKPILFKQVRPGYQERPFTLYKFRTMRPPQVPGEADRDRLTALGRFLRRTSLDELPGLLNVIRGDMSLVGPRPLLMRYLPYYTERERRRHDVPPGLTGWAQIHGRNTVTWDTRLSLDVWYVEHQSLGLDLRILGQTLRLVISGHGVVEAPNDVMADLDEYRRMPFSV